MEIEENKRDFFTVLSFWGCKIKIFELLLHLEIGTQFPFDMLAR